MTPTAKAATGAGRWSGGYARQAFGEVAGVAVDNSKGPSAGDLYVLEAKAVGAEGGAVDVFKPKPNPPEGGRGRRRRRVPEAPLGSEARRPRTAIAVSAGTGRVLVADSVKGAIFAFSAEGVYEEKLTGKGSPNGSFKSNEELGNVAALAVDEASRRYLRGRSRAPRRLPVQLRRGWEGWITNTPDRGSGRTARRRADAGRRRLRRRRGTWLVDRFGPGVVVPDVETGKVAKSALTRTSAVLTGHDQRRWQSGRIPLPVRRNAALGSETATQPRAPAKRSGHGEVKGLHAGRTYYFRIVGENENGANYGLIREFQTPPAVEGLATGPVKDLRPKARR